MGMDVISSPFLVFLGSFAKLLQNVGILSERELRIPRTVQRANQAEPECVLVGSAFGVLVF